MLHSMTGFARTASDTALGTLTWEIRTVNHRYLDVHFRMPEELRGHEQALKTRLGQHLKRGKVECALNVKRPSDDVAALTLDKAVTARLGERLDELRQLLPELDAPSALDILRWPGVLQSASVEADTLFAAASALLDKALDSLQTMRAAEGERIAELLTARSDEIASIAASVRQRMPAVVAAARDKQRERVAKLDIEANPERLETELVLLAQKIDVDEELDRLDSHLVEIGKALEQREPVGRRLDFLMQELNREANTLASKSADAETTKAAVDLKVLIEQMREQIQNVE